MRLLILGGTRFLGLHLAEAALRAGDAVTVFHRGRTGPDLLPGAEHRFGDRDGGLDALAFAGGIGERGVDVRRRICTGLEFIGIHLDPDRNRAVPSEGIVSTPDSAVAVLIVKTDEERIVARAVAGVLKGQV